MTIILAITTTICAINWFLRYLSCASLLWYLEQKGIPAPSGVEMEQGCRWVMRHILRDLRCRFDNNTPQILEAMKKWLK